MHSWHSGTAFFLLLTYQTLKRWWDLQIEIVLSFWFSQVVEIVNYLSLRHKLRESSEKSTVTCLNSSTELKIRWVTCMVKVQLQSWSCHPELVEKGTLHYNFDCMAAKKAPYHPRCAHSLFMYYLVSCCTVRNYCKRSTNQKWQFH